MTFTIEERVTTERPIQDVIACLDDDVERLASWRRPPWMLPARTFNLAIDRVSD